MGGRGAFYCLMLGVALCGASCVAPTPGQTRRSQRWESILAEETARDQRGNGNHPRRIEADGVLIQTSYTGGPPQRSLDNDPGEPAGRSPPNASAPEEKSDTGAASMPNDGRAVGETLEEAPLQETDRAFPVTLATALRLSDARPLVVAAAQASAWVAEAQLQRAQVLWVPTLDIGAVYYRHDGFGPDFNRGVNHPDFGFPGGGGPLNQNLNYFYGYGSFYQSVNVTDAWFQPLLARQVLDARRFDIQAAKNDALLATADAYFDVHQYRGQYAAALDVVARGEKLVERIDHLSEDLVPKIEVDRSKWLLAAMQQKAASGREQWRVASANLTQVLRLDPSAVVVPVEHDHLQITLIDPARPLDELVSIAEANRPEIGAQKSLIQAAEVGIRREKNRPLLPLVLLTGFQTPGNMMSQFGIFGTGFDRNLNLWSFREDVSFQLVWQLEGMGFGNLARIKEQRGLRVRTPSSSISRCRTPSPRKSTPRAGRASRRRPCASSRPSDRCARPLSRTTGTTRVSNRPRGSGTFYTRSTGHRKQSSARSRLMESYDQYFVTVADYNRAQFELFHALGYPAAEVANRNPPGDVIPGDTGRPFGLPAVGEGPPPATR